MVILGPRKPRVVDVKSKRAVAAGESTPTPIAPFCLITNLFKPELLAVKMSPTPELSTTNEAKEVAPEIVATDRVPEVAVRFNLPNCTAAAVSIFWGKDKVTFPPITLAVPPLTVT